jgi:uncharacterized membrane protein YgaE (UPF0421/DUF939 family)
MQTQTIHYQQGKFRPIQPEPATQVVNKPATNSSKQRHFSNSNKQGQGNIQALATRQIEQQQTFYSQTRIDYRDTSSKSTAYPREETGYTHGRDNKVQTIKEA